MDKATEKTRFKVAVIGAGFGGLGMGHYLRKAGFDDFVIFEKAEDVGGVWRENTYPGAGCDVPSHFYSYTFEPHYPWQYRYGKQYEILEYMRYVARQYDLYRHMRFGTEVVAAEFDASRAVWKIKSASGEKFEAETLISAVGQLHRPSIPNIPGRDSFKGVTFHSAEWDHDFDMNGKKVAVIGTGASAVQFVPEIAKQVAELHVFQRSPGWVGPKFEKAFAPWQRWLLDHIPLLHDLDRLRIFLICEGLALAYNGNALAEKFVTWLSKTQLKLQVKDPELRAKLTPTYSIGCKRLLLTTEWLRALVKPNVSVITECVSEITPTAVRTEDGELREVDVIVYGTGFAATEFLAPMQVKGLDGELLHERWAKGAHAYLGMAVNGFPNFFTLYGPNSNLGSGSIIYMLEHQQRYITRLLEHRRANSWDYAYVTAAAHDAYNAEIQRRSAGSTYSGDCQSWYKTEDGINTNNWIGSMREYAKRTREPVMADYALVKLESETSVAKAA